MPIDQSVEIKKRRKGKGSSKLTVQPVRKDGPVPATKRNKGYPRDRGKRG